MNRIRLLSEQVANQIAAGEVVERPASVVKELVENALDAQALRIVVEVQAGGRSLIRVTDDGIGMNRDDALLCLERHATSKIRQAEDLASIATMGFRGEALPSIASVCRMSLTTQERGSDGTATQILINGGKMAEVKAAGAPAGTCIEVRQLFFNLPARRKFLRSDETEYGHIHHYLTMVALAYPQIAFTFLRDSKPVWQLPSIALGDGAAGRLAALRERLRVVSGLHELLLPLDCAVVLEDTPTSVFEEEDQTPEANSDSPDRVRVWGFLGPPGASRASREEQHLFVNRRPVENRGLNMALLEGYHTALMKGRYPICCLFLEVDPSRVDVNIHPAKREVKFRNERGMRRLVAQAVRQTLLDYHGTHPPPGAPPPRPGVNLSAVSEHSINLLNVPATLPSHSSRNAPELGGWRRSPTGPDRGVPQEEKPPVVPAVPGSKWAPAATVSAPIETATGSGSAIPLASKPAETFTTELLPAQKSGAGPLPLLDVPLRLVGVIGKLYVVLESDRGLVLMDQHAAHERILFEQMLHRMEQGQAPSQRLLLPETVEISIRDAQFLREQLPSLARLGVGLSEFGDRTFLLDALPPFVKVAEPRRFVLGLIDALKAAGQDVNSHRLGEDVIAKTVCRHAVKANDPLAVAELENLVKDLRHCEMPYTCPHGRPTLIEMGYKELEKKFGRSVS